MHHRDLPASVSSSDAPDHPQRQLLLVSKLDVMVSTQNNDVDDVQSVLIVLICCVEIVSVSLMKGVNTRFMLGLCTLNIKLSS